MAIAHRGRLQVGDTRHGDGEVLDHAVYTSVRQPVSYRFVEAAHHLGESLGLVLHRAHVPHGFDFDALVLHLGERVLGRLQLIAKLEEVCKRPHLCVLLLELGHLCSGRIELRVGGVILEGV
eukprot:scaffold21051_cov111-Isochrysis_galbana.AAC.3